MYRDQNLYVSEDARAREEVPVAHYKGGEADDEEQPEEKNDDGAVNDGGEDDVAVDVDLVPEDDDGAGGRTASFALYAGPHLRKVPVDADGAEHGLVTLLAGHVRGAALRASVGYTDVHVGALRWIKRVVADGRADLWVVPHASGILKALPRAIDPELWALQLFIRHSQARARPGDQRRAEFYLAAEELALLVLVTACLAPPARCSVGCF